MANQLRAIAFALGILMLSSSCSIEERCARPNLRHEVYLYATPEQTYLFFKDDPRPIGYTVDDTDFWTEINEVYQSHAGKDIGVDASICGKIRADDMPLRSYDQTMTIKAGTVSKLVDMTALIENYRRQLRTPMPGVLQGTKGE